MLEEPVSPTIRDSETKIRPRKEGSLSLTGAKLSGRSKKLSKFWSIGVGSQEKWILKDAISPLARGKFGCVILTSLQGKPRCANRKIVYTLPNLGIT